jgi:exonuclease SbcC
MINVLSLTNFQSHENTKLSFCKGVNSIVGASNQGKTAILRALYWLIYNRPSGIEFVSFWDQNNKGEPLTSTMVEVVFDNTTVSRIRKKTFNGYAIKSGEEKKILEAVGMSVPEEVNQLFNLTDVNIQKQMDAPFLLNDSPEEVARFFNRTIRLDLIDKMLALVEAKRRKVNSDIKSIEILREQLVKEIKKRAWLPTAQNLLVKAQRVHQRYQQNKIMLNSLEKSIFDFRCLKNKLEASQIIVNANNLIEKAEAISFSLGVQQREKGKIKNTIQAYDQLQRIIGKLPNLEDVEILFKEIDNKLKNVSSLKEEHKKINKTIRDYLDSINSLNQINKDLPTLISGLPSSCPLCGAIKEHWLL